MIESDSVKTDQNLTPEEYKKLCKRIRQHQIANSKGRKKTKPILKPIGQTVVVDKKVVIQQNPVDWDDIQAGTPFALDAQGVLIYTKAGTGKALCLNTMSTIPVGGASVYRVFL